MKKIYTLTFATILLITFACSKKTDNVADNSKGDSLKTKKEQLKIEKDNNQPKKDRGLIFDIEGTYKGETCNHLTIDLYYTEDDQLMYKLKSSEQEKTNKAEIELNNEKTGYYITLKGIQWSSYEGDLQNPSKEKLELPQEISADLSKGEIIFQNYGNAMDSYTVLDECGAKYVILRM